MILQFLICRCATDTHLIQLILLEHTCDLKGWIGKLDGCIVWNARNTVLGEEALLIYIVPVCYVKTGRYGKT